jgi:VanZ family protein
MAKIRAFIWRWGPAILMMAAIFTFSSIPSVELPNFGLLDFLVKKGGHALGYGLLALAFFRGLKAERSKVESGQLFVAWALAALFSATDEFHQSFVPGRNPAVTDVMIDACGAAVALFVVARYLKKRPATQAGH